jgi:hypothetical protein
MAVITRLPFYNFFNSRRLNGVELGSGKGFIGIDVIRILDFLSYIEKHLLKEYVT